MDEQQKVFISSDILLILELDKAFLSQLSDRMRLFTSKTILSDILLSFLPHFKMYTTYCTKFSVISELVAKLRLENKNFKSFIKRAESNSKHAIGDFLIAPVQHVPRFSLLIESLLKFTPEHNEEYKMLFEALKEAQKAAKNINQKIAEMEARAKVLSIQNRFDSTLNEFLEGSLVQPHRLFIKEGVLELKIPKLDFEDEDDSESESEKQEYQDKGKYYCFLFNDLFLISSLIGSSKAKRLVYESAFELGTTFVFDDPNELCFQVVNPRCTYNFISNSLLACKEWKQSIIEAISTILSQNACLESQRSKISLKLNEINNEWEAEIMTNAKCVRFNPQVYREEVVKNTQKHLTVFLHQNHQKLLKMNVVPCSPTNKHKSVLQRVKGSLTPKKRQKKIDNIPRSPNEFTKFEITENIDGISCINHQLDYLNQELDQIQKNQKKLKSSNSSSNFDLNSLNYEVKNHSNRKDIKSDYLSKKENQNFASNRRQTIFILPDDKNLKLNSLPNVQSDFPKRNLKRKSRVSLGVNQTISIKTQIPEPLFK